MSNKNKYLPLVSKSVAMRSPKEAAALLKEKRTLVCIIRHGQTDWNTILRLQGRENVPLNESGIKQSEKCAEIIQEAIGLGLNLKKIYSSPLERARTTAGIIANATGCDMEVEEGLIERDYGELSGLTLEERKERFPKGEKFAKNIENIDIAAYRFKKVLRKIAKESNGGDVIAVTHGGVLNALFLQITRGKTRTERNISKNCAISLLAVNKKASIPLAYNLSGDEFTKYIKELKA